MKRPLDRRPLRRTVARKAQQTRHRKYAGSHQGVVLRDDQVFENRHPGKEAYVLESTSNTSLAGDAELVDPLEQQDFAVDMHRETTGARSVKAGQAIEDRRLAGPVWSDQSGDLARIGGEGKIGNRDEPAKAHRQMLDGEQRLTALGEARHVEEGRATRRSEGSRCAKSPRGRHTMIATMAAPKISIR